MLPLFTTLAVGAAEPIYSAADWAARLADVPFGAEFSAQLSREWQPANPPDEFSAQMLEFSRAKLSEWHSGWPNLWAHTLRVAGNALALAPEAGVEPDQAFLMAVLHDIGKLDEMRTGEEHEMIAALIVRQQLKAHYSRIITNKIAAAVGKEESAPYALSGLLQDADKLDKIGATGIVRRVSQTVEPSSVPIALRHVAADLNTFPEMHYLGATALAKLKRAFTLQFLALAQQPIDA